MIIFYHRRNGFASGFLLEVFIIVNQSKDVFKKFTIRGVRIAAKESGKLVEAILTENYAIHDDGIYLEDDFHCQELPAEVKTMLEDRIQIYGDETRRLRD